MIQTDINQREWENNTNWKYGMFYFSPLDTRIWVAKREKWMGWTLNFSKWESYCWLFLLLAIPIGLVSSF
jgi:uncharacterized membrane protein